MNCISWVQNTLNHERNVSNRNRTKFKKWLEKVFYVENSLPATKVIDKDKVFFFFTNVDKYYRKLGFRHRFRQHRSMLMLIITRTKKNNHKLKNVEKGRNRLWMISCVKQKLLTERKNKKERKNERCIEVWHHHVSNLAFFSLFPPSFLLILLVATAATSCSLTNKYRNNYY